MLLLSFRGPLSTVVLCSAPSVPQPVFTITEKAPTRAFSWLKAFSVIVKTDCETDGSFYSTSPQCPLQQQVTPSTQLRTHSTQWGSGEERWWDVNIIAQR